MKSTLNSLLALSFSLLLAGACVPQAPQGDDTGGDLSILSNGPNLPEECNQCWDDFQTCFEDGNDMEQCAQQIVGCVDACQAPPPPPECLHCAAGFEACATTAQSNGDGAEDCAAGFAGCLSACESEAGCEQDPDLCDPVPPSTDCGGCDQHFDDCVNDQWQDGQNGDPAGEADKCADGWQDCWQNCEGDGTDPGGNDSGDGEDPSQPDGDCAVCDDMTQQCEDGGANGESCSDLQNYCSQVCP